MKKGDKVKVNYGAVDFLKHSVTSLHGPGPDPFNVRVYNMFYALVSEKLFTKDSIFTVVNAHGNVVRLEEVRDQRFPIEYFQVVPVLSNPREVLATCPGSSDWSPLSDRPWSF